MNSGRYLYLQAYPSKLYKEKQLPFINQGVGTTKALAWRREYMLISDSRTSKNIVKYLILRVKHKDYIRVTISI
jgi:hypothetical protein